MVSDAVENMKIISAIIISLAIATFVAFANQEKPVPFSKLRYEADMGGRSGKIIVEATQDGKAGLTAVSIFAFKKEHVLAKDHLAEISGAQWNSLRVIYDGGILGETIWIRVEVATSVGARDEALIRISSDGSILAGRRPKKDT
jgi:hypothetical protein